MDISIADFIIHVDESLPPEQMKQLEELVRKGTCVISACAPENKPQLMLVTYDPECTTSKQILETIKGEGVKAQSIGL
jgi:hypothetical protein